MHQCFVEICRRIQRDCTDIKWRRNEIDLKLVKVKSKMMFEMPPPLNFQFNSRHLAMTRSPVCSFLDTGTYIIHVSSKVERELLVKWCKMNIMHKINKIEKECQYKIKKHVNKNNYKEKWYSPPESFNPITGAPTFKAISITFPIFFA